MEAAAVDNIEKNIDHFEDYPTVQQVLRDDLDVSRRNSQELETALERLGAQAYKHFEVASFRSLSAAAETIGERQLKTLCDRAGDEKKQLAARFEKSLPQVTRDYLARVH